MELSRVVFGRSSSARFRYGAVAAGVGVLAAVVPLGVRLGGVFSGPGGGMEALGVTLLLLVIAGILAVVLPIGAGYQGAGLGVCIAIPTCLVLGLNVAYVTAVDALTVTLWQWAGPPFGVLLGFPIGLAGYLVGIGVTHLREHGDERAL